MYRVEVDSRGDEPFAVKSKDLQFAVDTKGRGMTPPDVLLAALGSCMAVYIRRYAEGAKLDVGSFKVTAEADFPPEKPARFSRIKISVDLGGTPLDERRKAALLEFVKNCPVHNTMKCDPAMDVTIKP